MKLSELEASLSAHAVAQPRLVLPDGRAIPPHFHVTEVGHVAKRFIDCGGLLHDTTHTCVLQTHVGDDVEHRLTAGRFAKILDLAHQVLPHDDLDVEIEYENGPVSQYPIAAAQRSGEYLDLVLREKRTACLAKERRRSEECCATTGCC